MNEELFHPVHESMMFVTVLLPLAVPKPYTYRVPTEMADDVVFGGRVEVQFGKSKVYSGLVVDIHNNAPKEYTPKYINSIIDREPIISTTQLRFWNWLADYYCCTHGEVMNAALPAALKLASETQVVINPLFDQNYDVLDEKEYMIAEALTIQNELSIDDLQKILQQKSVYPIIKRLLDKRVILLKEEFKNKYKPKVIHCVRLREPYSLTDIKSLEPAFKLLDRSERQAEALMAYIQVARNQPFTRVQELYDTAKVDSAVLKAIEKKGIFELYKKEISRIDGYEDDIEDTQPLAEQQINAIFQLREYFKEKNVALLHGVTGSGKTRVYVEMMEEVIAKGGQILYLLPEISLTTQIVSRLQRIFGDKISVYHSRLNDNERVELWHLTSAGKSIILGARSSLFLPFHKLQLIIVDEEHDPSYKQNEPAPRYNARDSAIYLAQLYGAKVLLGTATPSLETYFNAVKNKYGLVKMEQRFGGLELPRFVFSNTAVEAKQRKMQAHFSSLLLEELKLALGRGEQAILFQNRRGYAPYLECSTCDWTADCENCDVSLTYHKSANNLRCHYCGHGSVVPKICPACGGNQIIIKGFGTEKIEDEIKIYFPDANIGRMDMDTVKSRNAHAQLINDFEERRIDILVGTQMVTKGLDFDNVALVGVLNADQLLHFPDFRSGERAFQLLTQVAGRAGRKHKQGQVFIQGANPTHPVLREVMSSAFQAFFKREMTERRDFMYPPFYRLIKITLRHKKPEVVNEAARVYANELKKILGKRVIGPAIPSIGRIRNYFLMDMMIKIERDIEMIKLTKRTIFDTTQRVTAMQGFSTVDVLVDVDPY